LIYNPPPVYPPDAIAAGFTGRVLLRVSVRADGTVQSAAIFRSSGVDMLDNAALNVIDSWRFAPMDLPGDVWEVVVPIKFAIEEP
jgi:protein TonB